MEVGSTERKVTSIHAFRVSCSKTFQFEDEKNPSHIQPQKYQIRRHLTKLTLFIKTLQILKIYRENVSVQYRYMYMYKEKRCWQENLKLYSSLYVIQS